jgi:solute carrier family 25 folate transporter 32
VVSRTASLTSILSTQFSAEIKTLLRTERDAIATRGTKSNLSPAILKYRALYSGLTPALLGSGLSWGGYFFVYDQTKKLLLSEDKASNTSADFLKASCVSGVTMVLLTNPIWLVKARMQLQVKSAAGTHYRSVPNAFSTIVKQEGILALYKGVTPALMLVSHGMIQFYVYEHLKLMFPAIQRRNTASPKQHSPLIKLKDSAGYLLMGALSKVTASTVTYPIQLIKSRMQQRSEGYDVIKGVTKNDGSLVQFKNREYPSFVSAVSRIYKGEGFVGFFKGAGTNAFRVAPNAAITFVVYEAVVDALSR